MRQKKTTQRTELVSATLSLKHRTMRTIRRKCRTKMIAKQCANTKQSTRSSLGPCTKRIGKNQLYWSERNVAQKKAIENIWKSNSNNKSLQVNEAECVFDWLNYAHRDWNVNTCSFFLMRFRSLVFFLQSLWHGCRFDFSHNHNHYWAESDKPNGTLGSRKKNCNRVRQWCSSWSGWLLVVS